VSWAGEPDAVKAIRKALEVSDVVSSVVLGGSRAGGRATELSDWDVYVEGEPEEMMAEIPALVASLGPLAAFWEPLSEEAGYMVVMDGPTKIDVFPLGARRHVQPPWRLDADSLPAIDAHFWDWTLWLGGKSLRGEWGLVADELHKMYRFLLAPVGVAIAPTSLDEAVASYLRARRQAEDSLGVVIQGELGRQVSEALRRHVLLVN
jgi:Nucleotidyltransferase domain